MEMDCQLRNSNNINFVLFIVAYPALSMKRWTFVIVFVYLLNVSIVKTVDSESPIDNGIYIYI